MAFDRVSYHKIFSLQGTEIICKQDMVIPTSIILEPGHHAFPGQAAPLLFRSVLYQHVIASGGAERIHYLDAYAGIDLREQVCYRSRRAV